jgi:hypothetical protein
MEISRLGCRAVEGTAGATEESVRQGSSESAEASPPMLDPTWTHEKGYAHALALLSLIENR